MNPFIIAAATTVPIISFFIGRYLGIRSGVKRTIKAIELMASVEEAVRADALPPGPSKWQQKLEEMQRRQAERLKKNTQ